jgi:hypothetical protein
LTENPVVIYTLSFTSFWWLPLLNTFTVPEGICVSCGKKLNAAKSLCCEPARPGDITICNYCGAFMCFGPEMELLPADEGLLRAVRQSALWAEVAALQRKRDRLLF